jgi:hypothetical protein
MKKTHGHSFSAAGGDLRGDRLRLKDIQRSVYLSAGEEPFIDFECEVSWN